MKSYLKIGHLLFFLKGCIFVFLITAIFLFITPSISFGEENVFTVNNVKVKGRIDINFSRNKYFNKAFSKSFDSLMNKILLTRDLKKVDDIKLNEIKDLIKSFQVLEESFRNEEYKISLKIFFSDIKVKKFLAKKNISYTQPDNISAIFYPVLFVNDEIKDANENFFYKLWPEVKLENEIINFILPLEDLDDISKIVKIKNKIEEINVEDLVNKYDVENYVFALADHQNSKLNVYLKMKFKNNIVSKNILYDIDNIKDESKLNYILEDLKLKITDVWKEENLINLLMPLSIQVEFKNSNIKNLDELRNTLYKISIIDNYTLEEFNIKNSIFKIYYYGDPKKLRSELLKFGYQLKNDKGFWQLYLNE
tara:strand:- start:1315 stop:2412 length:1098 start_codon:yes stop_codon:yes gene_type:complete